MMHIMWGIAIAASIVQAIITGLLIRNYVGIVGFTKLGKILVLTSGVLLAESIFMTLIYYVWALSGLGALVSVPVTVITLLNIVAVVMLYMISRM